MFLAFFHVVLCVTLSSPLFLLLLFLASCQVQCEQLHCLESHATLNATQTANAPRGRERVSEWLAEHEALGQQLRQLAVPCSLCRFPLALPLYAVHKVKTKTVNIKRSSQLALSTFHCTVVRWPIRNALDDGRRDRDYSGRGRWESSQSYLNVTWGCISVSPSAVATTTSTANLQLRCKNLQKKSKLIN